MARAIEIDENGKTVLTDGIMFGPKPKRLRQADLKPGDVLIWYSASRSRISSTIREFSGGAYSHIGVYTGKNYSVDAGPEGVTETPVSIANGSYVQVMRKSSLDPTEQAIVVAAARKFKDYRYAWLDAITLPLRRRAYWRRWNPHRSKWDWITGSAWLALFGRCLISLRQRHPPSQKIFCSHVIVETYASIGYFPMKLADSGVFTPNDLAVDSSFTYIGWLSKTNKPIWHPLDPYSPEPVGQRRWRFSLVRILRGTSIGGK